MPPVMLELMTGPELAVTMGCVDATSRTPVSILSLPNLTLPLNVALVPVSLRAADELDAGSPLNKNLSIKYIKNNKVNIWKNILVSIVDVSQSEMIKDFKSKLTKILAKN